MRTDALTVRVPATTANLGPGFDSLGLALQLYNRVGVVPAGETAVEITGHGSRELPRDKTNLMLQAADELARRAGRRLPPLRWTAHHDIPLARGLGSSSAAIVAGLVVAREVLGLEVSADELVEVASELEGHPDNVAPAVLGGLTVCLPESRPLRVLRLRPREGLVVVLCIPVARVETDAARRVLPEKVAFGEAVFNAGRAAGMVAALSEGLWDALGECSRDKLHQPYRLRLFRGGEAIMAAAVEAGAHAAVVSGSGSTIAAFATEAAGAVGRAMLEAAAGEGVEACVATVEPDVAGATVVEEP